MEQEYYPARILDIIQESPSVRRYFFEMSDQVQFRFEAGQFVILGLPISHKYPYRSYSIASPPSQDNRFELCIVLKEDGAGTPYIFDHYQPGVEVPCTLPKGRFMLTPDLPDLIIFICTGTGIAPLRSMAIEALKKRNYKGDIHMVFGNRKEEDILYREEMEALSRDFPNFHFHPVLSRAPEWPGLKGYVHPVYLNLLEQYPGKKPLFYICGWGNMVKEARDNLKALGYTRQEIKFELYD